MTKLDHVVLPDEAARYVTTQVDAGRFHSVDEALAAGIGALQERDNEGREWLALARERVVQGRAAFARGETSEVAPDELMDGIEKELGIA